MNPKTFLHNTSFSVQLPYIPGHSFKQNHTGLPTKNLDFRDDYSEFMQTSFLTS